ncbi:MerR family glutamine synthetase transcriptional repressor [Salirhabdus euzebyi]|uniref:MerR family glutamine synthetase transcriptional repressor n=1 Tax=Salirhabdus euzebyi TaxID=394506 RepID=A0A841Q847_9BACI|nr:MerR family transcriptional regulator [Salirhabdus euzebyi]MBB6454467.1 MerR family glutamine synthetase transcriptional repressor [Salirhabdus euzebyi]
MNNNIPDHLPKFPMSVVKDLTKLTARQIRYYENQELIKPDRNESNHRVYSVKDINRLKEIKHLINQGINIAGIKALLNKE